MISLELFASITLILLSIAAFMTVLWRIEVGERRAEREIEGKKFEAVKKELMDVKRVARRVDGRTRRAGGLFDCPTVIYTKELMI